MVCGIWWSHTKITGPFRVVRIKIEQPKGPKIKEKNIKVKSTQRKQEQEREREKVRKNYWNQFLFRIRIVTITNLTREGERSSWVARIVRLMISIDLRFACTDTARNPTSNLWICREYVCQRSAAVPTKKDLMINLLPISISICFFFHFSCVKCDAFVSSVDQPIPPRTNPLVEWEME